MKNNNSKRQLGFSGMSRFSLILVFFLFFKPDFAFSEFQEYELKAVYLERITRFMKWPDEAQRFNDAKEFIIGIFGENPFGAKIEDLYIGRKMNNKPIKINYLTNLNEIDKCQMLFIPHSKRKELSQILDITYKKPILTVGDTHGFSEKGVLVNLLILDDQIRFEINEQGFHDSGISIDTLILKVSKIVNPVKTTD